MNKVYNYLLCILVSTSIVFGHENGDLSDQTSLDRLRMLVSKNPRLLKISAIMGISTLILFLCYKLSYKKPVAIPNPEAEKDAQKKSPQNQHEGHPALDGQREPKSLWNRYGDDLRG